MSGPGVSYDYDNDPAWTAADLVVSVGLEGDLAGWTATWRWQLVDKDGRQVDPADSLANAQIAVAGDVALSPPRGVVTLGDASMTRVLRDFRAPWMPVAVRRRALAVGSALPAWARAAERLQKRPGRQGTPDAEYVLWVLRRIEADSEDAPVKWMSERYGRTVTSIQNRLTKARERGLATFRPVRLTAKGECLVEEAQRIAEGSQ